MYILIGFIRRFIFKIMSEISIILSQLVDVHILKLMFYYYLRQRVRMYVCMYGYACKSMDV